MSIIGEEAKEVLASAVELMKSTTAALIAFKNKLEWDKELLERKGPVTDEEIARELAVSKMEFEAREARAKAEKIEADVRLALATNRQNQINRMNHGGNGGKPVPQRSTNQRRPDVQSQEGKKLEPKVLTQSIGEKFPKILTPS